MQRAAAVQVELASQGGSQPMIRVAPPVPAGAPPLGSPPLAFTPPLDRLPPVPSPPIELVPPPPLPDALVPPDARVPPVLDPCRVGESPELEQPSAAPPNAKRIQVVSARMLSPPCWSIPARDGTDQKR